MNNIFSYLGIDLFAINLINNPMSNKNNRYNYYNANVEGTINLIDYYTILGINSINVYGHCVLFESNEKYILYNVDKLINRVGKKGLVNMLTTINENPLGTINKLMDDRLKSRLITLGKVCQDNYVKILSIGRGYDGYYSIYDDKYIRDIIKQIRSVYSGKLTYSASLEEASKITWWDDCDYIGINFYPKLTDNNPADEDELFKAYYNVNKEDVIGVSPYEFLKNLYTKYNKPIYITEFGVEMGTSCSGQNNKMISDQKTNWSDVQFSAYKAFFRFVSQCDFIVGVNLYGDCIDYDNWNDVKIKGDLKIENLIKETSSSLLKK